MLPKELLPYHVDNTELCRIGPRKDGGYIVHKKTIFFTKEILTFGLSNNWGFEKNFLKLKKECKVLAFDHSVDINFFKEQSKEQLKKLIFFKNFSLNNIAKILQYFNYQSFFSYPNLHIQKKIGLGENLLDINQVFQIYNPNNCLLKIDIEGSEYEILPQIKNYINYINTIIIEFHDIDKDENIILIKKFINSIDKLKLIHIHGNNFTGTDYKKDPKTIELTFVNNDYIPVKNYKTKKKYPIKYLDYANSKGKFYRRKKDINLIFSN